MTSIVSGIFGGGDSSKDAAQVQAAATLEGVAEQRRQFDITQERITPFVEAGGLAIEQQQALLGLLGPEREQEAIGSFTESAGQQFLREQQERSLIRNASAIGGLGGGNVRTALQQQAAGRASTNLGEFQNRLAALSGTGQTGATQLGQLGQQSASSIAAGLQSAGQAQASGILGAQQANAALGGQVLTTGLGAAAGAGLFGTGAATLFGGSAGTGALIGLLSDARLKENIVKVDELMPGIGIYTWDWTEEGEEIAGDQPSFGVIAQEVREVIPEAVFELNGCLRVDYEEVKKCLH